jgi:outer membrane receptor protein involved in Fe transport
VAADEAVATLGEIIVTAQKREQNLQDVPVVVTAISEQLLHDTGVKDIKELTVLTPGLIVTSTSSEASTTARIRGVGTVGDNPGLESSVGIVIDGVYRPRNGVGFGDLGEMERVEVLKGPQGTLFGKNTSAGVINVVSKKPTFDPSSTTEVTGGNYGLFDVSTSLNGPIFGDNVAGRLFAAIRKREGVLNVETAGGNRPDKDADRDFYTVRGQLLFNFSDDINLRLIADITERDEQCCAAVQVVTGPTRAIIDALAPGSGTANPADPFARVAYANRGYGQQTKDKGVSAELNWDLGEMDLTSITAARDWRSIRGQDTDYTTADIWYRNSDGNVQSEFRQFSEELRLAGKFGSIDWMVGAFYANEKLNTKDQLLYGSAFEPYVSLVSTGGASATQLATWAGLPFGTLYVPGTGLKDSYQQKSESYALFTNETWEITDGLELTVGARYTAETKDLDSHYSNPGGAGSTACAGLLTNLASIPVPSRAAALGYGCGTWADPAFNNVSTTQSLDESEVTGTVKLAYRFNETVMTYLSYARGYKASGFNLDRERSTFTVIDTNTSFPAEFVDSFELGAKTTLADGAVLLNVAAFQQTFEDFQLNTFLGTSFVVTAISEVTSTGVDADVIYRTPFGLGIQGGVTYAITEITDFGPAATVVVPNRLNDRLGFAPIWSGSLSVTYNRDIGNYALGSNIGAKYNSSYNTGSNLDPRKLQEAYTVVNARLGFGAQDQTWTVELWGQNLTNEDYYQVAFDAPLQANAIDAFLGTPRLYGASLILKF